MDGSHPPGTTDLTGETLCERYFLRELRGSGGMADVYQAWDRIRSAKMAIKVLHPGIEQQSLEYKLFEKEAELLRKLEHPYIVRLYEFEHHGQLLFLVMDWIEGTDLRQKIVDIKHPFPLEDISRILHPVCSALHFTHQNQVYHCDIKPGNILLHNDGRVLLTDFGVARLATEKHGGGTPAYMAPEQILGRKVDARTDVYSLGITLFEMLSGGKTPFRGETHNSKGSTKQERIRWEQCNAPPPPLSMYNSRLPTAMIEVASRAIHKDPARRYSTTMELLEDFEQARTQHHETDREPEVERTIIHQPPPAPPPPKPTKLIVRAPRSATSGAFLLGQAGQYAGQIIPIDTDKVTIGRSSDNQLWFREQSVSRSHALITRTHRAVYIQDEDSKLGTYVNNERIYGPVILKHGDLIQIGYDQVFEFRSK
jgi:serine/threonine protein kinase